ncbi:MAG: hypothetical protein JWM31_443 [Solirubrobacterales bacterium]|nr:hypothetical protein [Solirubrobacterales bacterium]
MPAACTHLDRIEVVPPEPEAIGGCEECLKAGGRWVHLRVCLTCGKVGCCDDSPNKHATAHFHESGHPLIHSGEPGEQWSYCYVDDQAFVVDIAPD